jgi:hypothetical protein
VPPARAPTYGQTSRKTPSREGATSSTLSLSDKASQILVFIRGLDHEGWRESRLLSESTKKGTAREAAFVAGTDKGQAWPSPEQHESLQCHQLENLDDTLPCKQKPPDAAYLGQHGPAMMPPKKELAHGSIAS